MSMSIQRNVFVAGVLYFAVAGIWASQPAGAQYCPSGGSADCQAEQVKASSTCDVVYKSMPSQREDCRASAARSADRCISDCQKRAEKVNACRAKCTSSSGATGTATCRELERARLQECDRTTGGTALGQDKAACRRRAQDEAGACIKTCQGC